MNISIFSAFRILCFLFCFCELSKEICCFCEKRWKHRFLNPLNSHTCSALLKAKIVRIWALIYFKVCFVYHPKYNILCCLLQIVHENTHTSSYITCMIIVCWKGLSLLLKWEKAKCGEEYPQMISHISNYGSL